MADIIGDGISLELHRKNEPRTDTEDRYIAWNPLSKIVIMNGYWCNKLPEGKKNLLWQNFFKIWNA